MKKYKIIFAFLLCITFLFIYLQWGRDMELCHTNSERSENWYSEDITIVANKIYIQDKQKFAESVIQKCVENTWKEIRFSYDLGGYPNELNIDVYMNNYAYEYIKIPNFRIKYIQKNTLNNNYNIKDNPDAFTLKIE